MLDRADDRRSSTGEPIEALFELRGTLVDPRVTAGRAAIASLVAAIERDQSAGRVRRELDPDTVAQQMVVTVLGMLAVTELDLPIEIDRIEQALLGLI